MVKRLLLFFLLLIFLSITANSFAWDSTAAKYYPLSIGNLWSYHRIDRGPDCIDKAKEFDFIVRISSDTIISGKRYFRLEGITTNLERIDSTTMKVYRYSGGN